MFEDGMRIDDILNILKKPTLDKRKKKKLEQISDAAIRYEVKQSTGEEIIKYDFTRNLGGLLCAKN